MPINNEGRLLLSEVLAKQVDTDWPAANTDFDLFVQDLIAAGNVIANGLIIRNIEVSDSILTGNVTASGITANTLTLDIITANTFNGLPPANLSLLTTDDLNEGSANLYFTVERARNAYTEGQGIAISANGVISTRGSDTGLGAFNSGINLMANSFAGSSFQTVKTFPLIEGNSFVAFSIHVTNISEETAYLSGRFVFDSNNILFANLLEIPRYTSIEVLQKPQIFKPGDAIEIQSFDSSQTPANDVLSFYVSYQGTLDTTFNRSGITIDDNQNHLVYDTSQQISVVESINLVNLGSNVMPTTVTIVDGGDNLVTYLSSNLQIPPYSSVELCEYPKSLVDGHKIKVQKFDNPQQMTILTSSKFTSSYTINPSILTINEDEVVQFDILTTNILDGTILYYEIEPVTGNLTQDDFITSLEGNVVIINNGVRLSVQANTDLNLDIESDETFRLVLRKGSNAGPIVKISDTVTLKDTSNTTTYVAVEENAFLLTTASPAQNAFYNVNIVNGKINETIYWTLSGNTDITNFVQANTGSFVIGSNLYQTNITLTTANVIPAGEERVFNLEFRRGSYTGSILYTSNTITLVTVPVYMQALGGQVIVSGNYTIHAFTDSNTFTVTRLAVPSINNVVEYMLVAGGGGGNFVSISPGGWGGGGAGAGGVLFGNATVNLGVNGVIVGGGGTAGYYPPRGPANNTRGGNSEMFGYVAVGGGAAVPTPDSATGGSGGGHNGAGISGQGYPGTGYGGGGAGGAGFTPGRAGDGVPVSWVPNAFGTTAPTPGRWFGGGGGANYATAPSSSPFGSTIAGGYGGGGTGQFFGSPSGTAGSGVVNTGGGGGSLGPLNNPDWQFSAQRGGFGGSGVVIVRYKTS